MKTKSVIKILILFLTLFLCPLAYAQERYEFYNGVRALGMGGAAVAVVNDETALLYNPAALGKLRDFYVTIVDPELSFNGNTERIVGTDVMSFMDPQKTLEAVREKPTKHFHQRAQVFPSIVVPNFGFGVYGRYSADASVNEDVTVFDYNYRNDFAGVLGANFSFFDGRVKLGVNARAVNRVEAHRNDLDPQSTNLEIENIAKEGFGVGTDIGLILTAPWAMLPTLAAVYRDAGKTSYTVNDGMFHSTENRPDRTPPTLDVGLALFPIANPGLRWTFTAEVVDVLAKIEESEDDDIMRRLHGGFEINYGDVFFFRGGANQGYWTAGMELATRSYQLQLASYGEEIGTKNDKKEDRRYVGKFSWRF